MPATATVRALSVVILVVTALFGTAYVLGRSLTADPVPVPPAGLLPAPTGAH
ncbi:polysaccharide deacetylase family protein, partial [Micromonospora echinofusca]|nr:polysaccharide deacetylase family protein [Micromonospora echinofusca]